MKSFSLARIKNIEREPVIFGMGFAQARAYGIFLAVELLYILISHSWLEIIVCLILAVAAYLAIAAVFSTDLLNNLCDEQLPGQIINGTDDGN